MPLSDPVLLLAFLRSSLVPLRSGFFLRTQWTPTTSRFRRHTRFGSPAPIPAAPYSPETPFPPNLLVPFAQLFFFFLRSQIVDLLFTFFQPQFRPGTPPFLFPAFLAFYPPPYFSPRLRWGPAFATSSRISKALIAIPPSSLIS